jgi:aspartate aminotransferase-like enzyme/GNAT superfamily N-acetyltransferase
MILPVHGLADPLETEAKEPGRPTGAAQPSDAGKVVMNRSRDRRQADGWVSAAPTLERNDNAILLHLGRFRFKRAEADAELEQVHRLNHETFVLEVAQYGDTGSKHLVDKFHHKNTYIVAVDGDDLVGMVAVHDRPPFAVADRLPDPSVLDGLGGRPMEVRLLAVRPAYRRGPVFSGLLWALREHARRLGHTRLLISGLEARVPLYEKLGFRALGPAVACGRAAFVPMTLELDRPPESLRRTIRLWEGHLGRGAAQDGHDPISLLPGPVRISEGVRAAWAEPPQSHRSEAFIEQYEGIRDRLSGLAEGSPRVALFVGSGTLANDVVAATLAADRGCGTGLILVNGEFGARLARQALRFGLKFRALRQHWGRPWDLTAAAQAMANDRSVGWVWGVHLESSTGVLNDVAGLHDVAAGAGVRVCIDGVSSLGAVPMGLRGVHLATGSSGKALGAYAGVGIVFAAPDAIAMCARRRVPMYLHLRSALAARGPQFTVPSPLLASLDRALDDYATPVARDARYAHYAALGRFVRSGLRSLGLDPIAEEASAAPVITTFGPPPGWSSDAFAAACRGLGYEIAYASGYLRRRGWLQIATMGDLAEEDVTPLFAGLARRLARSAGRSRRPRHVQSEGPLPLELAR